MIFSNYIKPLAHSVIDYSDLAFDLGFWFNPIGNFSIIPFRNGYLASFRVFGYFITGDTQSYQCLENMRLENPDQHLFLLLDRDFNFIHQLHLTKNTYYKPDEFENERTYLEDGRLTKWNNEIYFTTATFYQHNEQWSKMGLEVQKLTIKKSEIQAEHTWNSYEHHHLGRYKNFMPIPNQPFKYITGTSKNGAQTIDISKDCFRDVGNYDKEDLYRGNTPLINWDNGYLTITHKLIEDELGRKRYINFFVRYDQNLKPIHFSQPFKLCESNIEFVTVLFEQGDDLVIGVTEMDDTPYLMRFNKRKMVNELCI